MSFFSRLLGTLQSSFSFGTGTNKVKVYAESGLVKVEHHADSAAPHKSGTVALLADVVTNSVDGIMLATDKAKLDRLVSGSGKVTIADVAPSTPSVGDVWIKNG